MLGGIVCAVVGFAFVLLGCFGLYSVSQAPMARIPLIYASLMMGLILMTIGILRVVYGRHGRLGAVSGGEGYSGPSIDVSAGSSFGHGGNCGHSGGADGGACGGDGGGGH